MQYGQVPGVDKVVSRLVLGTMVISDAEPSAPGTEFPFLGLEGSFELLDRVAAAGGNAFDSAHVYGADGASEKGLGLWMQDRGNRGEMFVITKGGVRKPEPYRVLPEFLHADIAESLERLQTSYIDLYIAHYDEPRVPVGGLVEAFEEEIEAGRIHAWGGSNWSTERITDAIDYATEHDLRPPVATQPHFSLAEQLAHPWGGSNTTLAGPQHEAEREWYRQTQFAVFPYSSLSRGFFSGRLTRSAFGADPSIVDRACRTAYCHEVNFRRLDRAVELAERRAVKVPQIAIAFVLSSGLNVFPLVGAATPQEYDELCGALDLHLSPAEHAYLDLRTDTLEAVHSG